MAAWAPDNQREKHRKRDFLPLLIIAAALFLVIFFNLHV